jgi:hypothetical protein
MEGLLYSWEVVVVVVVAVIAGGDGLVGIAAMHTLRHSSSKDRNSPFRVT